MLRQQSHILNRFIHPLVWWNPRPKMLQEVKLETFVEPPPRPDIIGRKQSCPIRIHEDVAGIEIGLVCWPEPVLKEVPLPVQTFLTQGHRRGAFEFCHNPTDRKPFAKLHTTVVLQVIILVELLIWFKIIWIILMIHV